MTKGTFSFRKKSDTYFSTFCRLDIMALLFAAFCFLTFSGAAHAKQVEDIDITRAIETEIWIDEAVNANTIDVQTRQGVVSLTGTANHILARERAAKLAGNIVGVRAVVNQITVEPILIMSDEKLQQAIVRALRNDPATDSYEITVKTTDGEVTLTGTVDSWQEWTLCATVAKGVMGVTDVKNEITVNYKTERPDQEITEEIAALLENDVRVDDYMIKVESKNGKVSLSGTVGSLAEKDRAILNAHVAGVSDVNATALEIEWWARDKMRRKEAYANRSDAQIKKAVEDAFLYDPRILSFKLDIAVDAGKVTLSGVVDNLKAKMAAEEDAENVIGVWHVKNHIKVRPVEIASNEVLEQRVADALLVNPWVNRFEIGIDAVAGLIYLTGDVTTSFEKSVAEQVATNVKGVVSVVNNITYPVGWTWKPDQEIREDVRDELFWSPYVDEEQVNVTVSMGVVTLTGNVETWSEQAAAEDNAYEGGARNVINNLTVTYPFHGPYYSSPYYW